MGIGRGESGAPSTVHLRRAGKAEWELLPVVSVFDFRKGDRLRLVTAGGGGYGPASERDPEAARRDVVQHLATESEPSRRTAKAQVA